MKLPGTPWIAYAVAAGATLVALLVRWALAPVLGEWAPLTLLTPAVIAAAWIGGLRPGLFATALCAVTGTYFFLAPANSFAVDGPGEWIRIAAFVGEGVLISWLFQRIRRKRRLLEREVSERRRSEEELKAQKELLQTTLTSVGDGMIATDVEGRVTFLNPVAEKLTGWSDAEARGVPLTTVFRIVNEQTGAEVENPAIRALREGTIVGLANHTLLVSKDGSIRPIDDSASPIRGGDGATRGAILVFRDVTEAKQAQERLRSSEERLRSIIEATPECVKLVAADGSLLLMNDAGLRMIEAADFASVSGACVYDLIAPEHRRDWVEFNARVCGGASERFEFDVVGLQGSRRHMETHAVPVKMPDGTTAHLAVTRDMTERKRAEAKLRESEERYRLIGEASHDAIWDWNLRTNGVVWNPGIRALFGYAEEQVTPTGDWWLEQIHDDDRERVAHGIHAVIDGKTGSDDWSDEYRFRRADGDYVAVLDRGRVVRDASGAATRMVGAMLDLTERNLAAAKLREAEERFEFVRRSSGVGFWYCDLPFDVLEWDETVKAHFHLPPDAVVTIGTFYDRIHPDDREPTRQAIERSIAERTPYDVDYRTVHPATGEEFWINAIGRTFYDPSGAPRRFDGVTLDVTERKRAESAIRQSESRFRTLVEQAKDYAIFMIDLDGRPTSWNEGVARALGFEEEDFVGADVTCIFTPEDIERGVPQQELEEAAENGRASDDRWMRRKDGTRFFALGSTSALRDADGQLVGFLKVMRDQTERKRLEDDLRKIAADLSEADRRKNEFLATLAHELRNPLAPIRTGLELLKLAKEDPQEIEEVRDVMERQTLQMVRLIDDLLEISRITQGKLELRVARVPIADVVQSAVETVRPLVDEAGHRLSIEIPSEPIHVRADAARLAQVVSNLLHNAVKFTPEGGQIDLSVATVPSQNGEPRSVAIAVRDDGVGIPDGLQHRIFDMFAQLDGALERGAKGLGIGLTLVKQLVEMHGGTVRVESAGTGQGSEFVVTLPLDDGDRAEEKQVERGERELSEKGKLRVLIVDDNRAAADLLAKVVRGAGDEVFLAYDGAEAIEAAERHRPDVALMDLGMPRMNGYEAARRLRQEPWGESIVLVALTGWGQEDDRRRTREAGFDHHLVKPAEPAEIRRILNEARRTSS